MDTVSFSYESALRAAIRFPMQETEEDSVAPEELAQTLLSSVAERDRELEKSRRDQAQFVEPALAGQASASESPVSKSPSLESPSLESLTARRSASVTIRLSGAECARLKQRAAQAGLTLSAYVRSCTFEAEALRAQVKQAVKELRGELRGDLFGEFNSDSRGEARRDLRADIFGKKPPASEASLLAMDAPLDSADARRQWWKLGPSQKNLPAQA
jgi:hypothetical protein